MLLSGISQFPTATATMTVTAATASRAPRICQAPSQGFSIATALAPTQPHLAQGGVPAAPGSHRWWQSSEAIPLHLVAPR